MKRALATISILSLLFLAGCTNQAPPDTQRTVWLGEEFTLAPMQAVQVIDSNRLNEKIEFVLEEVVFGLCKDNACVTLPAKARIRVSMVGETTVNSGARPSESFELTSGEDASFGEYRIAALAIGGNRSSPTAAFKVTKTASQ